MRDHSSNDYLSSFHLFGCNRDGKVAGFTESFRDVYDSIDGGARWE
jgi:hypothetical protein